jgi:hypothetical protein
VSNKIKIQIIAIVVLLLFGHTFDVNAAACNSSNLFLSRNGDVGWGDTPLNAAWSPVTIAPNSQVRLSVGGEDGCAGQSVNFQIKQNGSVVKTVSGSLVKGRQITSQVSQLYFDWTSDVPVGSYTFRAMATQLGLFSDDSSNTLTIAQNNQQCRLTTVNTSPPNGTNFGTPIRINVTGQGTCNDWGVTVNIYEVTGGTNTFIATIPEQKFSGTSTQLTFSWNPVRNPGAGLQAGYRADAVLGTQTLSSNPFIVSGAGGGIPPTGGCGTPGQPACAPGANQTYSFNIPNPLRGGANDFASLIRIIAQWIFNLAIPIAVAMIVYAGILFLTSQGEPAKITKAKEVLTYAVIGLAIILIGSGFITLIQSILELGSSR